MTRCYGVLVTIVVLATNAIHIEAQSIAVNHELRQLFELCLGNNHLRTHVICDLHMCNKGRHARSKFVCNVVIL